MCSINYQERVEWRYAFLMIDKAQIGSIMFHIDSTYSSKSVEIASLEEKLLFTTSIIHVALFYSFIRNVTFCRFETLCMNWMNQSRRKEGEGGRVSGRMYI